MPDNYMIQYFKKYCLENCEKKKIFENPVKYEIHLVSAAIGCLTCVHLRKTNHFIERVPEQKIKEVAKLQKFKNRTKHILGALFIGD